jgi:hypothetical protein
MSEDVDVTTDLDGAMARFKANRPQPKSVKITLGSGEVRTTVLGKTRQKWQQLRKLLAALDWLRIEGISGKDELLCAYEADGAFEAEGEDISDARLYATVAKLVRLNMDSVREALAHQAAQSKTLLDGAARCVSVMSDSVGALQRLYEQRLKMVELLTGGEDEDGLMSGKLVELLAPHLIKELGKPNGAG